VVGNANRLNGNIELGKVPQRQYSNAWKGNA